MASLSGRANEQSPESRIPPQRYVSVDAHSLKVPLAKGLYRIETPKGSRDV